MSAENSSEAEVPSPCIGVCCPDEKDICMGCFRSMEEITRWWDMSNEEKMELLKILPSRGTYL
jgi:hypothetical protein